MAVDSGNGSGDGAGMAIMRLVGATPDLVHVVCDSLSADENFETACRLAGFYLSEGPPDALMASALRSGEARAKKAADAANARWGRRRAGSADNQDKKP